MPATAREQKRARRNKFEDTLTSQSGPRSKRGTAQADRSYGSLTIRLNVPVVRVDQVWLDHSHKVRKTSCAVMRGRVDLSLTSVRVDDN